MTEGKDRTGRYDTEVAAQLPCDEKEFPLVHLEPVTENVVQMQWHHPVHGVGCLTVMSDGPGRDMLEPRADCVDDDPAQRLRLDRAGARFLIRPEVSHQCLRLRDDQQGAEVVQGSCSGVKEFEIELTALPV